MLAKMNQEDNKGHVLLHFKQRDQIGKAWRYGSSYSRCAFSPKDFISYNAWLVSRSIHWL